MAEPDQRAELERLRKMKRLQELQAKSGNTATQTNAPGINITPAQPQAQQPKANIFDRADTAINDLVQEELREKQRIYPDSTFVIQQDADGNPMVRMLPENPAERMDQPQDRYADKGLQRWAMQANGSTFGLGDEIADLVGAKGAASEFRQFRDRARKERPLESGLIEAVSATPTGGAVTKSVSTAAPALKLGPGTAAGIGGGVYGAADADGSAVDRIDDAAIGIGGGATIGKALQSALGASKNLTRAVSGEKTPGQGAVDEFGVRLTRGQNTGDARQISTEQAMARGGRSQGAEDVMRPFMDDQREAVRAAGRGLAGDSYATANEAGAAVTEGIKRQAGQAKDEVAELYEAARSYGAKMKTEGVNAMPGAVRNSLSDDIRFLLDGSPEQAAQSLPVTTAALKAVERLKTDVARAGQKGKVTALDFNRIETARKAINGMFDRNMKPQDKRALTQLKNGFDNYIDSAVDNALFEGDDAFLEAYKRARTSRAKFAQNFEANKVFEKLVEADATPEQTLDYILGAAKIAPTERVRKVVPQLKKALGEDSEAWAALQEAAIKRVMVQTDKTYNPKVLRDNLDDLLQGRSESVAKELFGPEQYARLRRFRGVVARLVPPEGSVNTSNTAYELNRIIQQEAGGIFKGRGGATMRALITKYLPDRDAQLARQATGSGAITSSPTTYLPGEVVPAAAIAGNEGANRALEYVGLNR